MFYLPGRIGDHTQKALPPGELAKREKQPDRRSAISGVEISGEDVRLLIRATI